MTVAHGKLWGPKVGALVHRAGAHIVAGTVKRVSWYRDDVEAFVQGDDGTGYGWLHMCPYNNPANAPGHEPCFTAAGAENLTSTTHHPEP